MGEITHAIDYDKLLCLFVEKDDDLRPALMIPHTIGDKTYATDTFAIIIIPNKLLTKEYPPHHKAPKFDFVLDKLKECDEIFYKDVELFRALENSPKEPDTMHCEKCEGAGSCEHCGADCEDCEGEGVIPDPSKPERYAINKSFIEIGEYRFSPFFMGKLEQVLLETSVETFSVIKKNNTGLLIKAGEIEMVFAQKLYDEANNLPTD